jgi:hypothetical protein
MSMIFIYTNKRLLIMEKNFKTVLNELKSLKAQLTEDYIFNGEDGVMDDGMGQEMGMEQQPDPQMVQQQPQQMMGQGDSEEEIAMHAQEVIQHEPIIGKIRETAIEGLKKYADHPTSSLYEFFKKVFLESDKVLTDTGNKK